MISERATSQSKVLVIGIEFFKVATTKAKRKQQVLDASSYLAAPLLVFALLNATRIPNFAYIKGTTTRTTVASARREGLHIQVSSSGSHEGESPDKNTTSWSRQITSQSSSKTVLTYWPASKNSAPGILGKNVCSSGWKRSRKRTVFATSLQTQGVQIIKRSNVNKYVQAGIRSFR